MNVFLKFISWSRRIRIKQFQNVSGSLKIRKLKEKSGWRNLEVYGSHLRSDNDMYPALPPLHGVQSNPSGRGLRNKKHDTNNYILHPGDLNHWSKLYLLYRLLPISPLPGTHIPPPWHQNDIKKHTNIVKGAFSQRCINMVDFRSPNVTFFF